MAAEVATRRQPTYSLSTIYSHEELDTLDVRDRSSGEVDAAEPDNDVLSKTSGDEAGAPANDHHRPPTAWHEPLRRQHAVRRDSGMSVINDVQTHLSAHRLESAETSQVPIIRRKHVITHTSASLD